MQTDDFIGFGDIYMDSKTEFYYKDNRDEMQFFVWGKLIVTIQHYQI